MRNPAASLFTQQLRGCYELARAMPLPGVETDATPASRTYFDFFSHSEKELT